MLALAWPAAHGLVLGALLGLKFLTAKAVFLLAIAAAALWFLSNAGRTWWARQDSNP